MNRSKLHLRLLVALPLMALVLLCGTCVNVSAAPSEGATFRAAEKAFEDGIFDVAEREFGEFIARFPKASKYGDAALYQARARFHLKNYDGAAVLLREQSPKAGKLADQYQFWLGESLYQKGDFANSATEFGRLIELFPASGRLLEAFNGRASALYQLKDYQGVIQLLGQSGGPFSKLAATGLNADKVHETKLILGESYLAAGQIPRALEVVQEPVLKKHSAQLEWRRQYLLCRVRMAEGSYPQANEALAQLLTMVPAGAVELSAQSLFLKGEVLERMNQPLEAIDAYQKVFVDGVSSERRRLSMLRVVDLMLKHAQPAETIQRLDAFLEKFPKDAGSDLARMTVGELRLKEYHTLSETIKTNPAPELVAARTNALGQALAQFDRLLTEVPEAARLPQAYLNRGWCRWESGLIPESMADFKAASERLPHSEEQALALFKWADTQFQIGDTAGAVTNYERLVREFADLPRIKSTLFDQALYQTVHAAIASGKIEAANGALRKILDWYPESYFSDRSMLLVGQALTRFSRTEDASRLFADFLKRFPQSALAAEAQLALARTQVKQGNWSEAINLHENWLKSHGANAPQPRAEFDLAWLYYRSGNDTNAFSGFTNFLARFPTNTLAPLAQNWVADFYRRQEKLDLAELGYLALYKNTNWAGSELVFQAGMMAGRMAVGRQGFAEARGYFTNLINDPQCPVKVLAEAWFALGDTYLEEGARDLAINAYNRIVTNPERFATNPLVPLAYAQIGNCQMQLAAQDTRRYDYAVTNYQTAFNSPLASLKTRCLSKIGMGIALEKKAATMPSGEQAAVLRQARDSYLDVVYHEKIAERGDVPDPSLVKEAGIAVGRLLEQFQQYAEAKNVYERMAKMLPGLGPLMKKRISYCEEQILALPAKLETKK